MNSGRILKLIAITAGIAILIVVGLALCLNRSHETNFSNKDNEWADHTTFNIDPVLISTDSMLFRLDRVRFAHLFQLERSDFRNDKRVLGVYENQKQPLDAIHNTGVMFYTSIDLKDDKSLDQVLTIEEQATPPIENPEVAVMDTRLKQGPPTDSIICSYMGDQNGLREFRHSRDFVSYNLNVKTLSIRYGENEPLDIAEPQNMEQTPHPLSFAFYKHGQKVFFIVYGWNAEKSDPAEALNDDFLGKVVKWQDNNQEN